MATYVAIAVVCVFVLHTAWDYGRQAKNHKALLLWLPLAFFLTAWAAFNYAYLMLVDWPFVVGEFIMAGGIYAYVQAVQRAQGRSRNRKTREGQSQKTKLVPAIKKALELRARSSQVALSSNEVIFFTYDGEMWKATEGGIKRLDDFKPERSSPMHERRNGHHQPPTLDDLPVADPY